MPDERRQISLRQTARRPPAAQLSTEPVPRRRLRRQSPRTSPHHKPRAENPAPNEKELPARPCRGRPLRAGTSRTGRSGSRPAAGRGRSRPPRQGAGPGERPGWPSRTRMASSPRPRVRMSQMTGRLRAREAFTELVTSSLTTISTVSASSASFHSQRISQVQARAQPGAVSTAPSSGKARGGREQGCSAVALGAVRAGMRASGVCCWRCPGPRGERPARGRRLSPAGAPGRESLGYPVACAGAGPVWGG